VFFRQKRVEHPQRRIFKQFDTVGPRLSGLLCFVK